MCEKLGYWGGGGGGEFVVSVRSVLVDLVSFLIVKKDDIGCAR